MNFFVAAVLGSGICWGFMGFFTRHLQAFGIGSVGVIIVRCVVAAVCFGIYILVSDPKQFRFRLKDLWCFLGTGLVSLLFFSYCYYSAMNLMSLSAAAILLYTAPTIVMLLSAVLFREKITPAKLVAVALAFAGCCLVSGVTGGTSLTLQGVLFGLGAGLGYALFTIFSRYAMQRGYTGSTINFYSCLLAAVGALLIWGPQDLAACAFSSASSLIWCVAVGIFSCFLPYLLYTYGLTGLENGRASVLASVEPVVASLIGIFIYHEIPTAASLAGVLLVLAAVILLSLPISKRQGQS